ncbi:hypothetical protein Hamer_G023870 [Homarus americanus]|uniref:Uncharacterized protein n=1 Tax=Homarus americanus TaxID=6706 RepID=A0A8J5JGB1_HOMAM|nr:hypothetical protein Hamer_G023870 [Homarus americanus]
MLCGHTIKECSILKRKETFRDKDTAPVLSSSSSSNSTCAVTRSMSAHDAASDHVVSSPISDSNDANAYAISDLNDSNDLGLNNIYDGQEVNPDNSEELSNIPITAEALKEAQISDTNQAEDVRCLLQDFPQLFGDISQRLADACLTINLLKSEFGHAKLVYRGHIVGFGEVSPVTAKVEAINNLPIPDLDTVFLLDRLDVKARKKVFTNDGFTRFLCRLYLWFRSH